jgi:hypothetical protein
MTNFAAKEPALGYYYQIRYGLMLMLMDNVENDACLAFETLDDIVIEDNNSTNLIQTKYHKNRDANLTNRGIDLWKTIRVWSHAIYNNLIELNKTYFILITTEKLPPESIFQKLMSCGLTSEEAVIQLSSIASETSNQTNQSAYNAFNKLSEIQKKSLVEKIRIISSSFDFPDMKDLIMKKLRLSVEPRYLERVFERVEGWWFNQIIALLQSEEQNIIRFTEILYKVRDIAEQFKLDSLPIDFYERIVDVESFSKKTFVKKLDEINLKENSILNAINDYLRTFKQRSSWVRENLLNPNDEQKYESELIDDWKVKYDFMVDECIDMGESLPSLGKTFYKNFYINNIPKIFIRPKVTYPFLIRGSYQILSNQDKIHWLPKI